MTFPFPTFCPGVLVWNTVFTNTFTSNSGSYSGYSSRMRINSAGFSAFTGSQVRVTFQAATTSSLVLAQAYIGEVAAAGDAWDFATTPTQLFFSGSAGVTIASSGNTVTDPAAFAFDNTKNYIVSINITTGNARFGGGSANFETYFKAASSEAGTADVSGYTNIDRMEHLSVIEVA